MITRTRVIAAAIAIATTLVAGAALAQSPSDYDGVVDITIRNNSTTTAIHGPVAVEVRAQNMVDGGYIEDDGSDILFTDDANLPAGGVAPVLDSNEATWWWYVDVEPESSTDVRLFVGGPAIEPLFPFDENASVTIDDNADLDQTATLDLVVEFVTEELPDGTAQIVSKSGAYELGIRDDGELYATLTLENLTDILRPDGAGAETGYASVHGSCTYAWQCIDEVTADDSASYIRQGNTTGTMFYRSYTLTNHTIPTGAILQEARVVYRARLTPNSHFVQPGLRRSSYRKLGAEYTSAASGYATVVSEPIDRPVCCGHTWPTMPISHLNALEVVIGVKQTNTLVPPLTQVYVEVDYRASTDVDPVLTHQGIEPGRRYLVRLALDGSTATLDIDGVEVDTAPMPRGIRDSDSDLIFGGDDDGDGVAFHGGIGGLVIGPSAATSTLSMSFRSEAITPGTDGTSANSWEWTGTISTDSDSGTNATYTITHDPTDVDIVIGPLILAPNQRPGQATTDTPDLVGEVPLAVFLTPGPSPTPSPGRSFFIGPLIESAESSGMPADAWWILVGTLVVGPATALGFKHLRSYVIMSIAGVVAIFVISQIAGLGVWWTAFSALWKAGMIGITQYWRGS